MEIPENYFGGIFARSGLAVKEGLRPANCVAVLMRTTGGARSKFLSITTQQSGGR